MHITTTRASNGKSCLNKGWLNEGNVKVNLFKIDYYSRQSKEMHLEAKIQNFKDGQCSCLIAIRAQE